MSRDVSLSDAAQITGKSKATIRRLMARYHLDRISVGHEVHVDLPDLLRAIENTKVGRPRGTARPTDIGT